MEQGLSIAMDPSTNTALVSDEHKIKGEASMTARNSMAAVIAYWKNIRQRKQKIIDKNNQNKKLKLQTAQIYSTWESTIVR